MPPDADTFEPDAPANQEKPQEALEAGGCPPDNNPAPDTQGGPTGKQQAKPLNPRHEAFCQYFVLGGNATYAARSAGYAPQSCNNQGYRLMRRPRIRARVAAIRCELARVYGLDAHVLLGKLEALYQRANEDHHFHAAVRAVEAQARIAGHLPGHVKMRAALAAGATGMTANDDFPAPAQDGNSAKSTGCAGSAAGNGDLRTT